MQSLGRGGSVLRYHLMAAVEDVSCTFLQLKSNSSQDVYDKGKTSRYTMVQSHHGKVIGYQNRPLLTLMKYIVSFVL